MGDNFHPQDNQMPMEVARGGGAEGEEVADNTVLRTTTEDTINHVMNTSQTQVGIISLHHNVF